ncbi:ADP-ribosylation factor-like protein 13A isoform X2 [Triplophysa rosa]|uniref:ADP-ribosylation factor-like protein 13A n=1 Tax=Triplophysa rosa TaxID=992332 RepID=A0A9W7WLD1_TRIRA|nr:ADP-ribosylation factor-like protein 13A isoform X2 [Triplophysa rosa]KAI7801798.1 putative ADP-ribosylation factor-like protein 13A [Triplophysa rosa]
MDADIQLCELRRRWCSPWCSPSQLNMFNLMSNCCSWVSKLQQPLRKVTVLVVGLDKAGKTSCVRGMMRVPPGEVGPTRGCVSTELRVENYLVNILDMGGAPEVRGSWIERYGEAHGIIFVIDSSDRQQMKDVREALVDLLKHPRVAGKPLLVLANKQDKMNALLGNELIEILSLERLVNQSRSLCHIEPCSSLMDLHRWSDRKTLRGLRWLLRAVCLDYPDLCARVMRDGKRPIGPEDKDWRGKTEKNCNKSKMERTRTSKIDIRQEQHTEKVTKNGTLQPIRNILNQENSFKKNLKKKKKVTIKIKKGSASQGAVKEEEVEETEAKQDQNALKDKSSNINWKHGKLKLKTKVKEKTLVSPESLQNEVPKTPKEKEERKRKKTVKGKRKNKINTEGVPAAYMQPVDLSTTFDLYRKAILALKARQEQEVAGR